MRDKQGDCDDLTMLYASLLEYSGIQTALISMSGHITLMFDTGIHERNWGVLPLGDSLVVKKDQSLWIPIEVTEVGKSFAQAWQAGGKKYREAQHDEDFEVITVRDVEGVYLSALPEELQNRIPDLPPTEFFQQAVANDLAWIEEQRTHAAIAAYWAVLESGTASDSVRNRLGIIFALQDSLAHAEVQFHDILARAPENAAALVNIANLKCISGSFREAEENYLKAAAQIANEPGLYLNLAIMYQLWKANEPGDSTRCQIESEKNLLRAFELLQGDEAVALDLLGIARGEFDFGEKADVTTWFKQQATAAKKFIKDSAKKYLFNKSVAGARVERKAVKRGVDKDRGYILWWAEGV